jgi:hypothetical protein
MLIPTPKFLVLPLIALAVIAALPSRDSGAEPREAHATVVRAKPDCARTDEAPQCKVATNTLGVVVR